MASITLTFEKPLNVSVQVGDTAYYTNDENGDTLVKIGDITTISSKTITANISNSTPRPTNNSFILFSKTNKTNISGLRGYYAEMQFKNNSTEKIELNTVSSEVFVSS